MLRLVHRHPLPGHLPLTTGPSAVQSAETQSEPAAQLRLPWPGTHRSRGGAAAACPAAQAVLRLLANAYILRLMHLTSGGRVAAAAASKLDLAAAGALAFHRCAVRWAAVWTAVMPRLSAMQACAIADAWLHPCAGSCLVMHVLQDRASE